MREPRPSEHSAPSALKRASTSVQRMSDGTGRAKTASNVRLCFVFIHADTTERYQVSTHE